MRAARMFALRLAHDGLSAKAARVKAELYGSLGATGKGHGSDKAVLLGLAGHEPDRVDVDAIPALLQAIRGASRLTLAEGPAIAFDERNDLVFHRRETLPFHANGMRFTAFDAQGAVLSERTYYSVGGGFVVSDEVAADGTRHKQVAPDTTVLPHPFHTGAELLARTDELTCSIAEVMRRNERHWRDDSAIDAGLDRIWQTMQACVARGCATPGVLPGGFKVRRRASALHRSPHRAGRSIAQRSAGGARLGQPVRARGQRRERRRRPRGHRADQRRGRHHPRGAALLRPLRAGRHDTGVRDFLLTAAAIGILYKENASISGAEVGCQGEVGVACSMAAGALCAVLGGTPAQAENAAEIGMEHHLGLTCDPVGGLVQIPCIERNAMASVKAINAARMALRGDGTHHVSLDKVIKTMRETGADMMTKYKETARGGLAVNIVEC